MKLVYKRGQWSHWSGYSVFLFRLPFDKFCSCLDKRPLLNPFLVSDRGLPCPVRWIRWLRRAHYFPASPAHPNSSSRSISTSVGGLRKRRHNQHSAQQGKDKWNRHVIQQLSWNCRICGLVDRALASCPVGRGSTWFESRPSRTKTLKIGTCFSLAKARKLSNADEIFVGVRSCCLLPPIGTSSSAWAVCVSWNSVGLSWKLRHEKIERNRPFCGTRLPLYMLLFFVAVATCFLWQLPVATRFTFKWIKSLLLWVVITFISFIFRSFAHLFR